MKLSDGTEVPYGREVEYRELRDKLVLVAFERLLVNTLLDSENVAKNCYEYVDAILKERIKHGS